MSIEQIWTSFFQQVKALFEMAALPFVTLAAQAGLPLNTAQVWMLFFTLLFAGYALHFLYVGWILDQRGRRATGKVVGMDPGDDGPDHPIIEFRDVSGRAFVVTSHLSVNKDTRAVGAPVDVIYDPNNPNHAREVGRQGAKALHLALLFAFVAFMAFGTWAAKDAIY